MNTAEGHISSTILLSYDVNPVNLIKAFFRPSKLLEDVIQTFKDVYLSQGFSLQNYLLPAICSQEPRHKMRFPHRSDIFIYTAGQGKN